MCNKGNPSQTSNQSGTSTTSQSGTSSGQQAGTSSQVLGPTPETLALYMQLLNQAQGVADPANFNPNTLVQTAPWTDAMNQAANYQWGLGQQGMGFVPEAAGMLGMGGQSTVGQIPGVAASLLSPWAGQAVDFGLSQGQKLGDFGLSQGQAIGNWATGQAQNIMSQGPQLQQFSQGAVDQYLSPYIQDVVDTTQAQFNNQNAIQGNQLIGQGIKQGNVFGGDRAGVAQGILAGQQQLAQAPVIAGLYNQGYAQALQEFNVQNQLAAQLQEFGANLGLQGLTAQGQLGMAGLQGQGQLGMAGLGMGLQASTAANQQAIAALGQNQNAALQAGQAFGQLGATQFGSNLAGGGQAIQAANLYPAYLQNLMNMQAGNASTLSAYPFQTTSWYGGLLGGLGPLTGSQQAGSNASISQQQSNQIANMISQQQGLVTPPQPNQFVQAAGLGLAGLGLFMKDGGEVPHMAEGGGVGPYGGKRAPYEMARSYIQDSGMRPGRLRAPDVPGDRPLTLQSLGRALTFMNLGSPPRAATAAAGNSGGTLGQLSSLLKTEGAKGAAGGLSSFFGSGGGNSINVTDPSATLKRGGLVSRYADGGWDDEEDIPEAAQYTAGQTSPELGSFLGIPQPPQQEDNAFGAFFKDFPSGDSSGSPAGPPEQGWATDLDMGEGSPAGPPEQAGDEEAPGFGPRQGGLGQGRWLSRGTPRSQPGFLQRWASNPLTQIGLGLASQNSPTALGGIGQGLAKAMPMIQKQRAADQEQEALDRKQTVDNSGMTQIVKFADGRIWDTGLPTPQSLSLKQGRIPAGYRQTATGELEPIPGGPGTAKVAPAETTAETTAVPATDAVMAEAVTQTPPQTEADEVSTALAFGAAKRSTITTPYKPKQLEILESFGWDAATTDFNAIRLANGDTSVVAGFGGGKVGAQMRGILRQRAAQYYIDMGLNPKDANDALAEFGALKRGASTLGQLDARMTAALEKAAQVAPIVTDLSEQIDRTQFPLLNTIILNAKKGIGDEKVVQYGIAIETLASNYGTALGMGNSVLTDFQTKRAQDLLQKGYSKGQMKAAVDQIMIEIDREQRGVSRAMDVFLGKRPGSAAGAVPAPSTSTPATPAPPMAPQAAPAAGETGIMRKQFKGKDGKPVWGVSRDSGKTWGPE